MFPLKVLYYSWWQRLVDNSALSRYWLVLREALAASCTLVRGFNLTDWSAEEVTKVIKQPIGAWHHSECFEWTFAHVCYCTMMPGELIWPACMR
jgi:hypothetical protein